MTETILIDAGEACDLVRAVLEYNGRSPGQVAFLGRDGMPIDVGWIQILCDGRPLAVRVAPDDDNDTRVLQEMSNQVLMAILNRSEDSVARNLAAAILNPKAG